MLIRVSPATLRRYRTVAAYAFRQWRLLAVILVTTAASSVAAALAPWPLKILVDHAIGGEPVPSLIRSILTALHLDIAPTTLVVAATLASLGLFALNSALDMTLTHAWAVAGQRMVYDLAGDVFYRLQRLSLRFHHRRTVGDLLSRLTGDTWCVYVFTEGLLVTPLQRILTLVTTGLIAWQLDPGLTLLSFAVAPVLVVLSIVHARQVKARTSRTRELHSRALSLVHQSLTSIPLVQAFDTERRNTERFRRISEDALVVSQRDSLVGGAYGLAGGLLTTFGAAVILYLGGQRVLSHAVPLGTFLVFLVYFRSIQGALQGLLGTYRGLKGAEANLDRVMEILDTEDGVRDAPYASPVLSRPRGQVRFAGVTFGYDPDRPVLRDVSLEARPGETLALVGPSGAGKSTLVSLIPRLFDPWQGQVFLDDVDLRSLQLRSLRTHVAVVLQDPFLLPLSVADNIAYGRPGASHADIVHAAQAANADEFIRRLPQGYDTVIGERGATLSGGEKQRLAIARALLKDAPVLILDEPTSALDAQTEALLLEALDRLAHGRTTFVIAHRLSTIRRADRIAVLDHGQLVEIGTHQALLDARGAYQRLHAAQTLSASHVA
jgi:ATP-binding cassette, subfamily B, bacterial